jgi:hypothetical protein
MVHVAVFLSLIAVGGVSAADPVKFYWIAKAFETKDTQCTGSSRDSLYMTNLNIGKYVGGDGTNSECVKAGNSRFYNVWCDTSTGARGIQEFIKSDCSDARFPSNPPDAGNRGGKTVDLVAKDECFYDDPSGLSVKSEGCFADQSKVPSGYRQFSHASRISVPWFIALLSLSTLFLHSWMSDVKAA